MKKCRKRTKSLILLVTVTLILSVSLFLTFNQQPVTSNTLTIPTQSTSPTSINSKMGTHLQQLLQTSDPTTEYEMIVFFEKTINYTQGISLLKNLGDIEIISNYTVLDGACIRAPIGMAETIAQQNYIRSITFNEKIKLAPNQIMTNGIQTKDTGVNLAIGATTLQNPPYNLNGTGVVVAVLDTGINPHTYLNWNRISYNESFVTGENYTDLNGHGTAVAGIIGASGGPAEGVAPAVEFLNLKVLDATGEGQNNWLILAINEALSSSGHSKADIISLSLGDINGTSYDSMSNAVNNAWNAGTIVVAAAGNEGGDLWNTYYETINSPGLGAYIITVGSAGGYNYGSVSYFSSRGPTDDNRSKPDIIAPGEGLTTLSSDGSSLRYGFSGTSAATPVVSGAIALLLDSNSNVSWISPNTTKAAIMMTAKDLGLNPFSQGAGLINISRAYNYLQDYYITETNNTPPLIITPIRAITPPMILSNTSVTILNLTIVVGNATRTPISNAYFSVSGNASDYTTYPIANYTLNDEQIFVNISFTVPPNMTVSNFSGTLNFINGSGNVLFTIPLSPPSVTSPSIYLLLLLFNSYRTTNPLVIGIIAGTAATVVIALAAIVLSIRRKPEAPPPEFGIEKGEGPPPPPPTPSEPEPEPEPEPESDFFS